MLSASFFTLAATVAFSALVVNAAVEPVFVKQSVNWDEHQFLAPGPDDVRSPCPGLNAYVSLILLLDGTPVSLHLLLFLRLANHGFLNRTGRNVGMEEILQAGLGMYHFPGVLGQFI